MDSDNSSTDHKSDASKQVGYKTMFAEAEYLSASYNFGNFDIVKELDKRRNFAINITSRRNTGKSVLLKDLCSKIKDWYENVYVVSMTAHLQPDLFDFVDTENIIHSFDEGRLEQIWTHQEQLVAKQKAVKTKPQDVKKVLVIFDDVISDPRVKKSSILNKFYVMGRHIHLASILLTQTFSGIPPLMRTNCDVAIAFHLNSYDDRDSFSRSYLSTRNNKIGMSIFDKVTKKPYQALIVLNFMISQNPEDYIKTYTAELKIPKFKMGAKGIGKFASRSASEANKVRNALIMPPLLSKTKKKDLD